MAEQCAFCGDAILEGYGVAITGTNLVFCDETCQEMFLSCQITDEDLADLDAREIADADDAAGI